MQPIVQIEKYTNDNGFEVSVVSTVKGRQAEVCLCKLGCIHVDIEKGTCDCDAGNAVYQNMMAYNLVTPVFECPDYKQK